MIKRGYKVVSADLKSAINKIVQYKRDESVTPNKECGPLTIFKDLFSAVHFMKKLEPPLRLFQCFYIPSKEESVWTSDVWFPCSRITVEKLIENNYDCLIPGTVDLADEVILAEELQA